jgi:phosphatidylglycerol:prolipoprotein diacylglycerol transferase
MRQTLIRIFLDEPWIWWKVDPATGIAGPGVGVLLVVVGLVWAATLLVRRRSLWAREERTTWLVWGGALLAVSVIPPFTPSFPIFGYGFMLLIGYLAAVWFAEGRARQEGIGPTVVFDAGFWLLVGGVLGARVFYLVQNAEDVFRDQHGFDAVAAAFNLSQGGLVLYGGMIGGAAGYFLFCHLRKIHPLQLADVITPSVFVGIGFGRLGCLLNGCCYGDRCQLPWAITFPRDSPPWMALVHRGFLDETAAATFPLHPTQIYSSLNAFLLAWLTAAYFPRRRRTGETLAVGCVLYPITRFVLEFLRGDEIGQFGTSLTIAQWVSFGILGVGVVLLVALSRTSRSRTGAAG